MPETLMALALGIGMAAACGFRVFVPMFVIGIAARTELLTVSEGFDWIGSSPALIAFGVATMLEIGAYYLPWLDNLLDAVTTPAAVIAGVIVSAACLAEVPPLLQWSLAIIAGGGAAGTVKTGLVGIRLGSTATSGGVVNPIVATIEWISSLALAMLALFLPILAALITLILVLVLVRFARRMLFRAAAGTSTSDPS